MYTDSIGKTKGASVKMNAKECIRTRRSVRSFAPVPLQKELVEAVVADAACAPSWKNTQISRYTLVTNADVKAHIAQNCTLGFTHNTGIINGAPALVVLSYKKGRSGFERDGSYTTAKGEQWQMFDAGVAAQTFCLAAWDRGLGTVIMGIFDEDAVAKAIELPADECVAALIAIGVPAETPDMRPRKPVDEILRTL